MSVKTLIQEAMEKDALGFEKTLKEELRRRMSLALEAKMNGLPEDEEDDEEETPEDDVELEPEDKDDDEDEQKDAENAKMRSESAQLDEISAKLAANYSIKASDASKHRKLPTKKVDNRYAGVKMADEKVRKMEGKSSSAKVAATKE
jgi:hypothetical protein